MINVTVNDYKKTLKCLDDSIADLSLKLCRSNTYGHCVNKEKLIKLIQVKELYTKFWNLNKIKNLYNRKIVGRNWEEHRYFNDIKGNFAEILVKKIYHIIRHDEEFSYKLPPIPFLGGFYIENIFIPCDLTEEEDYNKIICYMNSLEYKGFVNFEIDFEKKKIFSKTKKDIKEEFRYEKIEIDAYALFECISIKEIKKLIEKTI